MEAFGESLGLFVFQREEKLAGTFRLLYSHVLYVDLQNKED